MTTAVKNRDFFFSLSFSSEGPIRPGPTKGAAAAIQIQGEKEESSSSKFSLLETPGLLRATLSSTQGHRNRPRASPDEKPTTTATTRQRQRGHQPIARGRRQAADHGDTSQRTRENTAVHDRNAEHNFVEKERVEGSQRSDKNYATSYDLVVYTIKENKTYHTNIARIYRT